MILKSIAYCFLSVVGIYSQAQLLKDTNVVIVDIAKHDRVELAELIRQVNAAKPKVIGLDVFFWEDSLFRDTALVNVLNESANLVFGTRLYGHVKENFFLENRKSLSKFCEGKTYGFTNLVAYDSVVTEFQPRAFANFEMHYAFAIQIADAYSTKKTQLFVDRFNKEEKIVFKGGKQKYKVIKAKDVVSSSALMKDKIVLLGYAQGKDEDVFITSIHHNKTHKMHGVLIHANIISMILEKSYLN